MHRAATVSLLLVTLTAFAGHAQTRGQGETASVRGGVGFTVDPGSFLMGVEVPFAISENIALGPSFQAGVDDDTTFLAPTWVIEFRLPMGQNPFLPFAQLGAGAAYLKKERRGRDRDDWGFLADLSIGGDFWVTDDFAIGTKATFHLMPDDVAGENFLFSWQVLNGRFSF
jgi:hypothetical protein